MSSLNPVLYGNRLYGRTLYSENPDPVTTTLTMTDSVSSADALNDTIDKVLAEIVTLTDAALRKVNKPLADTTTVTDAIMKSLSHTLADSVTPSDAIAKSARKPMADSVTATDAFIFNFTKVLADSLTLTDADLKTVRRTLTDALSVQDSPISVVITKALSDILLLQDWLSLRLFKPSTWTVNVVKVPSSTLYGRVLFGRKLYSGEGGSAVTWNSQKPVQPNQGWKSFNQLEEQN